MIWKRNQKKKKKDERNGHITTRYIKVYYYFVLFSHWRNRPHTHSSVEGKEKNRKENQERRGKPVLFLYYLSVGKERKGYEKERKKKKKKDERKGQIAARYIKVYYYFVLFSHWRNRPYTHSSVEAIGASVNRPSIDPRLVDFWTASRGVGPFVGDSSIFLLVARWVIYFAQYYNIN